MTSAALDRFIRRFAALNVPFGLERSCKFDTRQIRPDRCLVSIGRSRFGRTDGERLAQIAALACEFGAPHGVERWLQAHERGASVVHFGCEDDGDRLVYKVYLEYVRAAREALSRPYAVSQDVVVHRALKWMPAREPARETIYRSTPAGRAGPEEALRAYAAAVPPEVMHFASAVFQRARATLDPRDMVFLDVADANSCRRSFDLQIYDADLTVAAIGDELRHLVRAFGLAEAGLEGLSSEGAAAKLGHVAGGRDAGAIPFVTIYYGAKGQ